MTRSPISSTSSSDTPQTSEAFRIAQHKIEEAQRTGTTQLDLSGEDGDDRPKLVELPESLRQLTQLESLNVSGNHLSALPDWLGNFTQLKSLDISDNRLTALPEWVGMLAGLESLKLSDNRVTVLPESLGKLVELRLLYFSRNQLEALPTSLRHLVQLQQLDLSENRLTALPEWIGQLTQLREIVVGYNKLGEVPPVLRSLKAVKKLWLYGLGLTNVPHWVGEFQALELLALGDNELTSLPEAISSLSQLNTLWLQADNVGNPLGRLPEWLSNLRMLHTLGAAGCGLTELPLSLAELPYLERLILENNPLNPELAAVYDEGVDAVKRYLTELAKGAKKRYEAKLLILGDGNEGKTCVSRAIRNLPFQPQVTTRGVDVEQWKFEHPDHLGETAKAITLNIWDFEGQEISHQTHQFFLTSESLYLLVFKCRDQFLMERAEYWMDTIRARAPQAKVVIVISQCEGRSPHVPLDKIEAQYRDMLAKEWFFAVGCEDGKNIEELQMFLQRSAADLEFMGSPWPESYDKAEQQLKAKAKTRAAHISRAKLTGIFARAGVSANTYEGAAASMARLGVITQFPDCADLRDFVVLKPQWLTKAISLVMEDGKLSEDKGEITLHRMEGIWSKARYPGMFATFHDCMKEFELCYDLEDQSKSCLVPLRFGYVAPTIPWSLVDGVKERRMQYKLYIRPPMGLMSRFIVKTHHMIVKTLDYPKGIYWHNGVFLRTTSPFPSEALCEFVPDDRVFHVQVRAAFPQNMCEQIHGYLQAVFSFFGGLTAERSYGCIQLDDKSGAERQCSGLHTEKRIYTAISKGRETFDCEFEEHEVDPHLLVGGFTSFNDFVLKRIAAAMRQEMDKPPEWAAPFLRGIGALLDWIKNNSDKLDRVLRGQTTLAAEFKQEMELKLHEYLNGMSAMLDDRDHTAAPGLISIMTKDRSPWSPATYFKKTYALTPYCECERNIHACEDGTVEFTKDREWWVKTAPWITRGTKLLVAGMQLAFAGMRAIIVGRRFL